MAQNVKYRMQDDLQGDEFCASLHVFYDGYDGMEHFNFSRKIDFH